MCIIHDPDKWSPILILKKVLELLNLYIIKKKTEEETDGMFERGYV